MFNSNHSTLKLSFYSIRNFSPSSGFKSTAGVFGRKFSAIFIQISAWRNDNGLIKRPIKWHFGQNWRRHFTIEFFIPLSMFKNNSIYSIYAPVQFKPDLSPKLADFSQFWLNPFTLTQKAVLVKVDLSVSLKVKGRLIEYYII